MKLTKAQQNMFWGAFAKAWKEHCGTSGQDPDDAAARDAWRRGLIREAAGAASLKDLYAQVVPDALLTGTRLAEVSKQAHPKYCFKMATGTGKTWVLQALLIWQLLNKNAALAEGLDDARFTRHFMVVAPGLIVYERLLDAFCGKLIAGSASGARDFGQSDMMKFAKKRRVSDYILRFRPFRLPRIEIPHFRHPRRLIRHFLAGDRMRLGRPAVPAGHRDAVLVGHILDPVISQHGVPVLDGDHG